jgi:SAM-dependent methyltransferase
MELHAAPRRYVQRLQQDLTRPSLCDPTRWILIGLHRKLVHIVEDLPASNRIVDFGCGSMPYRELFSQKYREYVGADLEGNALADCTIAADGKLPMADGSVDAVLSTQVLEHVLDPAAYLAEAHRVLRPGGFLILSTHGLWVYHPDPTDFWRWTPDGLRLTITRAGFRVNQMESVLSLSSVALQFWLSATHRRMPEPLRHIWAAAVQAVIGLIERRRGDAFSCDALDYVVVASRE